MILTIGETYLEVGPSGARKASGDLIPFLEALSLNAAGLYEGNLAEDENGKWLKKESHRLQEGVFLYFDHPGSKTLICNVDKEGKKSFINVDEPFFMVTSYFLSAFYEQFGKKRILIDLSYSLLRKKEAFDAYLEIIDFHKAKEKPRFMMDVLHEKELFKGKEEEVKARFALLEPYLDFLIADSSSLKLLYGEKRDDELIKSLPGHEGKTVFLFDRGKVYFEGRLVFHQKMNPASLLARPYYHGVLSALLDRETSLLPNYLSQDHFLASKAAEKAARKKGAYAFIDGEEMIGLIDEINGQEVIHEA